MATEENNTEATEQGQERPMTAGERLAAAKAAKAARKMAERGQQAEQVEEMALAQAAKATDWLGKHQRPVALGTVVLLAAVAGGLFFMSAQARTDREGG
ncbi:MAG: hypothetical protein KDB61_13625, partial [Planctomycetes bacterium]|nr:hypothetical protein [Planctomycetota bacterium]